ncbi:MAG: helix-turn-helix transcriptional regulator [Deltaproteobacteria bacterium]|nr:helix-turn-helix transcriptional regulator [Deltaproteobacteria bacterium]NND29042.1 helix-turn-helix transcriptional regulator [Myxococcales bacterium]
MAPVDRIGSAAIDFAEAAYDLELSQEQWLPNLLERGLPILEQGLGVAGYEYGRPPDSEAIELLDVHVASGPADFAERHLRALSTTDPEVLRRQLNPGSATTGSEHSRDHPEELAHYISHVDYCRDVLFLTAADWKGAGVAIVAPLKEVTTLSQQDAQRWQMLAAHVEAGHRLRQGVAVGGANREGTDALPHDAEAILDASSFRITDAVGPAKTSASAKRLRDAAVTADRARGKMRNTDPDHALEIWKALVRGRWSMVDWFDTDGRRFVLAIPNSPDVTDPRGLSERESQVVTYAVLGHSNKMIAYRLGLSTSRVSTLLRSSMRKMGFRTRAQLVNEMGDFPALE